MHPLDVIVPQENHPPFTAADDWLENVGGTILQYLEAQDTYSGSERVPPMALFRCKGGGKTRSLYEIAKTLKATRPDVAVIYVSFHGFSYLREWEQADPTEALCRRIAFAAMPGRDFSRSEEQYKDFEHASVSSKDVDKWLGKTPCVLLLDELNRMDALRIQDSTEGRDLAHFLKSTFLVGRGRYLAYSSDDISTLYQLSSLMEPYSVRRVKVTVLPTIPSLDVARKNLDLQALNARTALYYGLAPSLIYLAKEGGIRLQQRHNWRSIRGKQTELTAWKS